MKTVVHILMAAFAIGYTPLSVQAQTVENNVKAEVSAEAFTTYESGTSAFVYSPNGKWMYNSFQGIVMIYDFANDRMYEYGGKEEYYTVNSITDKGIAGGSLNDEAAWWSPEKEWQMLPAGKENQTKGGWVYTVSADGEMMVGSRENHNASIEFDNIPSRSPIVWTRTNEGNYTEYEDLPVENEDYGGRCPQAFDVLHISADKSVLLGRFVSWSGMLNLPIKYICGNDGKWKMEYMAKEWIINEAAEKPVYPRMMPVEPDVTIYMSDEEKQIYEQDLKLYNDSCEASMNDFSLSWPAYNPTEHKDTYFDLTSDNGRKRWNEYAAVYSVFGEKATIYNDSVNIYYEAESKYLKGDRVFQMAALNYLTMSQNTHWAAVQASQAIGSEDDYAAYNQPGLLDMQTGKFLFPLVENTTDLYIVNAVLNDGTVIFSDELFRSYVLPKGETSSTPFEEWIRKRSEKAYEDLKVFQADGGFLTGDIWSDGNGEKFSSTVYLDSHGGYLNWYMDLTLYDDYASSITEAKQTDSNFFARVNGDIAFVIGIQAKHAVIYSLNGQAQYEAPVDNNQIPLCGLNKGIYLLKVNDGKMNYMQKIIVK